MTTYEGLLKILADSYSAVGQTLWQMILFRCLAGTFAGSVVTVRTMLNEITTKETQGKAFGWYMFMKQVGIFIGVRNPWFCLETSLTDLKLLLTLLIVNLSRL